MTNEQIIRMAREAGFTDIEATALEYFYQAAFAAGAAHEREKQAEQVIVDNGSEVSSKTEAQEPVHIENIYKRGDKYFAWIGDDYVQIYTAPVSIHSESETDSFNSSIQTTVQQVDLTDDELCEIEKPHLVDYRIPLGGQYDFARAVIAAYKEKNK